MNNEADKRTRAIKKNSRQTAQEFQDQRFKEMSTIEKVRLTDAFFEFAKVLKNGRDKFIKNSCQSRKSA